MEVQGWWLSAQGWVSRGRPTSRDLCLRVGAQCPLKAVVSADLLALWHVHGTGLVAKHTTLYFQEGALTAPSPAVDTPRASQQATSPNQWRPPDAHLWWRWHCQHA